MKKRIWPLVLALALLAALAGCGQEPVDTLSSEETVQTPEEKLENNKAIDESQIRLYQAGESAAQTRTVHMETNCGDITLTLYPQEAPKAVENFIALAQAGYYNGLKFFRVDQNLMIQSGDPTNTGTGGESSYRDESGNSVGFEVEPSLNLYHFHGALGMSPKSDGTNGSQFYIITADSVDDDTLAKLESANFPQKVVDHYREAGGAPWLDTRQTVFGQVTGGLDIVDKIAMADVDETGDPEQPIVILTVTVEDAEAAPEAQE